MVFYGDLPRRRMFYSGIFLGIAYILLSVAVKFTGETNFPFNLEIFYAVNSSQVGFLNPLMILASKYGREYFWIPVTAVLLVSKKFRYTAVMLIGSFIIGIVLGELSKYVMAEPRPFLLIHSNLLLPPPTDYSYPSGHALIVSIGAIIAIISLPRYLSIPLTFEALLVSYSRIYTGVHWPIDVISGWILGSAISLILLYYDKYVLIIYKKVADFSRFLPRISE